MIGPTIPQFAQETKTASWQNSSRVVLLVAIGFFLLRLAYMAGPDLFPEEAYYWNYAKHLDLGYLDHPPLVGWLIYLGTSVFGDTAVGIRLFALICSVVTAFFTYLTASFFFGRRGGVMAVLLVQALPFFFMTGFIMTPDSSLTACWAGMLYFLTRVIFDRSARAWLGVGICLGLGMLSKYTIALLGPATLLFLLLDAPSRVWFRRAAPYAAVALAAVIFSPVVIWNAKQQWASFAFQTADRMAAPSICTLHHLAASILLFLMPVCLVLAVRSLLGRSELPQMEAARPACDRARFLLFTRVYVLVPLAVFVFFSFGHAVKLNWTGPLWLALIPMLAAYLSGPKCNAGSLLGRSWLVSIAVLCLVYLAFLNYLTFGIPGVPYASKIELLPVGWSEMGRALSLQKAECSRVAPGKTIVVGLDRNFIASEASFYQTNQAEGVRETTGAHLFGGAGLMFESWLPAKDQEGATLLLVSFREHDLKKSRIRKQCEKLDPIQEHWIERNGIKIRPFYTRIGYNYRCGTFSQHDHAGRNPSRSDKAAKAKAKQD